MPPQDSESHIDNHPSFALRPNKRIKRKRAANRRNAEKFNKRLRALQDLIPNCTKMDTTSVLDDAIKYLKSLQYQIQVMSVFSGLPSQVILPYYPPAEPAIAIAIAMRLGMAAQCNALAQQWMHHP